MLRGHWERFVLKIGVILYTSIYTNLTQAGATGIAGLTTVLFTYSCGLVSIVLPSFFQSLDMLYDDPRCTLRRVLSSNALHEIALGIHHVEVYTVVDQVILLSWLQLRWCGEIDSVLLAHVFYLRPCSCQSDEGGVEFREVGFQHFRGVAGWVDGDEDEACAVRNLFLQDVDCERHFVKFVRADVGAVAEAKVDLSVVSFHRLDICTEPPTMVYFPKRSCCVYSFPVRSLNVNGPPTLGFP